MLVQTDSFPLNRPEVMIPFAQEKFDSRGVLSDEKTLQKIRELIEGLVAWTTKLYKTSN